MSVTRGAATTSYTYDNCGRPTQIGGRTLTWDYEDRMTSYSGYSQAASYGYNGAGSRVSKSGTGGARTYKRDGVGVTAPVLSDGVATMVPGVSEKSGGQTSTILSDRMGSMKAVTNAGAVTDTAEFDAFGKVVSRTGTNATQKGFVGEAGYQEDGESGYKLLGHRYYDADTGRFLSRDPIQDGRNWYAYVDNNPLKAVDANGLYAIIIIFVDGGPKNPNGAHAIIGLEDEKGNVRWFGFRSDNVVTINDAPQEGDRHKASRREITKQQYLALLKSIMEDQLARLRKDGSKTEYNLNSYNCSSWIRTMLVNAAIVDESDDLLLSRPENLISDVTTHCGFAEVPMDPKWRVPKKKGGGSSRSSGSSGSEENSFGGPIFNSVHTPVR
jgi:RHS repeat-associated protein